jgi:HEAT repeat protein
MSDKVEDNLSKMAAAFPACPLCGAGGSFKLSGFRKDKVACGSCGGEWASPQFGTDADLAELTLNNAGKNQDLRGLVYTGLGIKKNKTPAWWRLARSDPKATAMGEHVAYHLNLAHFQPDPVLRDAATKALEGLGPLGQAEIDGIARGVHFGWQIPALHYLARHGDERWVEILRHDMEVEPGPKARRYPLLDELGQLGRLEAFRAAWELSALTGNDTLLARAGQLAEGYVARLADEVKNGDDKAREKAAPIAIAISGLTGNEEIRLKVIERLAKDRTPSVKIAAARALGAAGPDPRVIDALEAALKDTSSAPQDAILATSWLGVAKTALAGPPAHKPTVSETAEHSLARIGDPRAANTVVRRQVEQPGLLIRSVDQSMEFIKAVGPRAIDPLLEAMNSDDQLHRRRAAAFVLSLVETVPDARAVEPLVRLLFHPEDPAVRGSAAAALGLIGDRRAIEPLTRMAQGDGDLSNQAVARRVLAKMQGAS